MTDPKALLQKIAILPGLADSERAALAALLSTKKRYGLIWEDKAEDVEERLRTELPVLEEVVERRIMATAPGANGAEIGGDNPSQRGKASAHRGDSLFPEGDALSHRGDKALHEGDKGVHRGDKALHVRNEALHAGTNALHDGTEALHAGTRAVHAPTAPAHTLIEGDNLHALTALTFTHEGAIDVIYIDPPYNTGNKDFKYNDSFVDREDAYRHSKWLSFMHKRLVIARKLLKDTGVIFISIDDNENAQLKLLCDEVFGEENLISDVIWQSRKSVSNDTFISLNHNYTLIYAKNLSSKNKGEFRLPTSSEKFENPDNDPRGPWVADPFDAPNLRPNLTYGIINPTTGKEYWPPLGRCWRTSKEEYKKFFDDNRIIFGKKGVSKPQLKRFLDFAEEKGATSISIWNDVETTTNGTQQLEDVLGTKLFTNPKPLGLLNRILKLSSSFNKSATILDFFAGSGTTLHATMALNAEDGGSRRCILVTNNENNICEEVTYERNKRVIQGYTNSKGAAVPGLPANSLRYYRTAFVPAEKTEANRRRLTALSTELLQIKEGCYEPVAIPGLAPAAGAVYSGGGGRYLAVLYHSRAQPAAAAAIVAWVRGNFGSRISDSGLEEREDSGLEDTAALHPQSEIRNPKSGIRLYAFSPDADVAAEDFWEVRQWIEAVPLPEAIYNAYRATLRSIGLGRRG